MELDDVDDGVEHGADEGARDGLDDAEDDVGFAAGGAPEDCAGGFAGVEGGGRGRRMWIEGGEGGVAG